MARRKTVFTIILSFVVLATAFVLTSRRDDFVIPDEIRGIPLASHKLRYVRDPALTVPFPPRNPYSEEKYELGRTLFFDNRLSGANDMSCATCHSPDRSWTDGLPRAKGFGGKELKRRTPALFNVAFLPSFFWDSRAPNLEEQAKGPITSPDEMNQDLGELVKELNAIPEYVRRFQQAFPEENKPLSEKTIPYALATFERGILTGKAPFDRWIDGDEGAISNEAKFGFTLFHGKANCHICHRGWMFSNFSLNDIGLPDFGDEGRVLAGTGIRTRSLFKVPSLRNITRRAPYMHNGSLKTLEDVVDHYIKGGTVRRSTLSEFIQPLSLTEKEKKALITFLHSFESEDPKP